MSNSICIVTEAKEAYQCFSKCMSREFGPIPIHIDDCGRIEDDCDIIVGVLLDDDERLFDSWLQRYKELECTRNKKWWGLNDKEEILSMCLILGLDEVEYAELTELVTALQNSDKNENQQHIIKTRKALRDVDKHGDKQKIVDAHVDDCMKYLTTLHAAHDTQ